MIMAWARDSGFVVITHDLDFSAILASTEALGPSVIQVRTQDVLPDAIGSDVVQVLRDQRTALDQGAIVSVDQLTSRVRVLPIRKG
jgi:predicted nuclease of predicted toxin-antitoxin system